MIGLIQICSIVINVQFIFIIDQDKRVLELSIVLKFAEVTLLGLHINLS